MKPSPKTDPTHLHDDLEAVNLTRDLVAAPPLELWPRIVVRGDCPSTCSKPWWRRSSRRRPRMGEYQYYDFLALDRPLTPAEQETVSRLSSRVEPHPWRATFIYHCVPSWHLPP